MLLEKLSELLETTQALQALLEEEKQCLTVKSFGQLNTLLFNKQKLLQKIGASDKTISTEENLTIIESDQTLSHLKEDIEDRLRECKKNNEINGQLIEMSMKSNKHLMQILTQTKGQNTVTYDQKGVLNRGSLLGKDIEA
ncbi:flagella synthesis protein FlgN [Psychromonas algicola]|uniref:flagella synthesis protein FlgN n=1 Tax=Psychromonas algicola TaxID=2555642 RepID=UPI00106803D6|nr:flagellar protein FlgN [Psychromonas sp. RZ5]TEW46023.1 flagellar protein FlgN [Psychromonas sp. RZ5]